MTIYNPFRPHLVELDGKFAIRKLKFTFAWQYLDRDMDYWWTIYEFILRHCFYDNPLEPRLKLEKMSKKKTGKKMEKETKKKIKFASQYKKQ